MCGRPRIRSSSSLGPTSDGLETRVLPEGIVDGRYPVNGCGCDLPERIGLLRSQGLARPAEGKLTCGGRVDSNRP